MALPFFPIWSDKMFEFGDLWLIIVLILLGVGLMWVFNWLVARRVRSLSFSERGKAGVSAKQELIASKLQKEQELGTELALAAVEFMTLQKEGKDIKEVAISVVKNHPSAAWFLVQKFLAGDLDIGALMSGLKPATQGVLPLA